MKRLLTLCLFVALICPLAAGASTWGGHNGTIHLGFAPPPDLQASTQAEAMGDMGVLIEVYAILKDTLPLQHEGESILATGGYEFRLRIEGANDARIISKNIPTTHFDVSEDAAGVTCGLQPDITFVEDGIVLVVWKVLIPGAPKPVSFHLDPDGVKSIAKSGPVHDSGSYAIWTGSLQNRQHGLVFSAGYVPAYLNTTGELDLAERRGLGDWQDSGKFQLKK